MKTRIGPPALNAMLAILGIAIVLASAVAFGVDLKNRSVERNGCSVCDHGRLSPPDAFASRHAHR